MCVCKQGKVTVKHFLLEYPHYATQHMTLLTSAAQLFGQSWLQCNDIVKLNCFLSGSVDLNYEENCVLFSIVQQYILNTCHFAASTFDAKHIFYFFFCINTLFCVCVFVCLNRICVLM